MGFIGYHFICENFWEIVLPISPLFQSTLNLYSVWLRGWVVISLLLGPHNKSLSLGYTSLWKTNLTSYSKNNSEHIIFLKYSEIYQESFCLFLFMPKYNLRSDILESVMSSFLFSSAYHLTDESLNMWQVNKSIRTTTTEILKQQKTHICDICIYEMQIIYASRF